MALNVKIRTENPLSSLFHAYAVRVGSYTDDYSYGEEQSLYDWWDSQGYGYDEDYYDDDNVEVIWPKKNKRNGKKRYKSDKDRYDDYWDHLGHKDNGRSKRAKVIDINAKVVGGGEESSDTLFDSPRVVFYERYDDRSSGIEFQTLKEFDDFCAEEGYQVYSDEAQRIAYGETVHCCLDPLSRSYGIYCVIAEDTYEDLLYVAHNSECNSDRI